MTPLVRTLLLLAATASGRDGVAQEHAVPLPLPPGAVVVQTLSFPDGERESFHTVAEASSKGIGWIWELMEVQAGDTVRDTLRYSELAPDLAAAHRLWVFQGDKEEHPGYTTHALSRTVYGRLRATGSDSIQVMALEEPAGGALSAIIGFSRRGVPVRWRGTLSLAAPAPVTFPLLVNGRRVSVPALHLRGTLVARGRRYEPEIWVLADSTYPLLLKWRGVFNQPDNLLQTVRVDVPEESPSVALTDPSPARPGGGAGATELGGSEGTSPRLGLGVERELAERCRVELPGIYFAFNSAALTPTSDRSITALAGILNRHPEWTATLEGHTDSVGSAASNKVLSQRRVEAVRERLVTAHEVDGAKLRTVGYGSSRPREPNATVEGRARNRRVELVRECANGRARP